MPKKKWRRKEKVKMQKHLKGHRDLDQNCQGSVVRFTPVEIFQTSHLWIISCLHFSHRHARSVLGCHQSLMLGVDRQNSPSGVKMGVGDL